MMKMPILIVVLSILIAGNVWAACPYGTTQGAEAGVCTRSGCDGNCTYYVTSAPKPNPNNEYNIIVKPNEGAQGDIVLCKYWDFYGQNLNVRNIKVSEGITGMSSYAVINDGSGTLKLPSTLKIWNFLRLTMLFFKQ